MADSNRKRDLARDIIENTGTSLFLTGKAGTGKTTFLREIREESSKRVVVTAPTGIAAINAGGVTLHSFFQLDFAPFVPETQSMRTKNSFTQRFSKEKIQLIRGMDVLVIDEISMVRADVLDAVDAVLRRYRDRSKPFGGVQMLMIGDLQQLPPVVVESERDLIYRHYRSPYFFDSHALAELNYVTVELDKVYRQASGRFLDILNAIRDNRAGKEILDELNARYRPGFNPADSEGYIRLTTHNHLANVVNQRRMEELPSEPYRFIADIEGNFPESSYPVDRELVLKKGAQVMFVKNDTGEDRRFFNGMIGHVTAIDNEEVEVTPVDSEYPILVPKLEWENIKLEVDAENGNISEKREGAFRQYPLKNAWAITIHKSQGLTFDRAIIDAAASFTHGQTYVALSRCRTLEGLVLEKRIEPRAIICDSTVSDFMRSQQSATVDETRVKDLHQAYFSQLVDELFDFSHLSGAFEGTVRLVQENFSQIYPILVGKLVAERDRLKKDLSEVSLRYRNQLARIESETQEPDSYEPLLKRVREGAVYFSGLIGNLDGIIEDIPRNHDNRTVQKKLNERLEMLLDFYRIKSELLKKFAGEEFSVASYLDAKARAVLNHGEKKKQKVKVKIEPITSEYSEDNVHPQLFDQLVQWRRAKAKEEDVLAFMVLGTKTLLAIANYLPSDQRELLLMPGIGKQKAEKYGLELIDLVKDFVATADEVAVLPIPTRASRRRHKS